MRVVEFRVTPLDRIGRFAKRVMDLSMAGLLLIVLSPLLLAIALLIMLRVPEARPSLPKSGWAGTAAASAHHGQRRREPP